MASCWRSLTKCCTELCESRMLVIYMKGKVYKTVIRPTVLYGAETCATKKQQETQIEMRMLRWMCGVTYKDDIRNEHIRGTTRVEQASKNA